MLIIGIIFVALGASLMFATLKYRSRQSDIVFFLKGALFLFAIILLIFGGTAIYLFLST